MNQVELILPAVTCRHSSCTCQALLRLTSLVACHCDRDILSSWERGVFLLAYALRTLNFESDIHMYTSVEQLLAKRAAYSFAMARQRICLQRLWQPSAQRTAVRWLTTSCWPPRHASPGQPARHLQPQQGWRSFLGPTG